ncbi:MAG: hypothetical protein NVSMB9_12450 [Isosphaeraceae bacterium]
MLMCGARLLEYVAGVDLAVDQLVLRVSGEFLGSAPVGKMAFCTAVSLLGSGVATLLLAFLEGDGRSRNLAGLLGFVVVLTGCVFCLGYLFDAPFRSGEASIPMAFLTAIGMVALGSGLILGAGPETLLLRPFLGSSVQSRLLRVFLPSSVCAVLLATWLTHLVIRYAGQAYLAIFSALGLVGAMLATSLACAWLARRLGEELREGAEALQKGMDELEGKVAQRTSELSLANARLLELATTDGLTGLKNSRFFREALESAFAFAARRGLPLSVIMLDVDLFKSYNDTFGHPAGDEVLRSIGGLLLGRVRTHDVVARYGGEEFAVLLLGADQDVGRLLARRLSNAILEADWPLRRVTASFGIASMIAETPRAWALVEEADRALYQSKRSGRDRITHHDDLSMAPTEELSASGVNGERRR